ncbi:PKD domain-containing protein, partial [Bacteroidota bacterium]
MKKLYIIFALLLGYYSVQSQRLQSAEYFVGNDPGVGNATSLSITQGDTLNQVFSITVSSFAQGFNNLCVRVKDSIGIWSLTKTKIFYKMPLTASAAATPNVKRIEYFIDNDSGLGNASPISFTTSGDTVFQLFSIPISSLSDGFHNLCVRVQDSLGFWSLTHTNIFYKMPLTASSAATPNVKRIEYFVDNDPGLGNATPISFTTSGDTVYQLFSIPVSSLSEGFHNLSVRVQDSLGFWSLSHTKIFYKMPLTASAAATPNVKRIEYFVDNDPGLGNATPINFTTSGDTTFQLFSIPVSSLSEGFHNLSVRVQDSLGFWSLSHSKIFYIMNTYAAIPSTKIYGIEYFFDDDPGLGNGNPISITPTDTLNQIFGAPMTGLDSGLHYFSVRVMDSIGQWSLILADTFRVLGCNHPFANFTCPTSICIGDTLNISNNTTGTDQWISYQWDMDNDGTNEFSSLDDTAYVYSTPGTYTIKLSAINSSIFSFGCIDTLKTTITVHELPTTNVTAYGPTSFCNGDSVTLAANYGLGYTFQWLDNGFSIPNANSAFYHASANGDFSAEVTSFYGCKDTSTATTVSLYALPNAVITPSGPTSFCQGGLVTLNANTGTGLTYVWRKNGTVISGQTTSSLIVTEAANYVVEITNSNNCTSVSAPIATSVNPIPNATITAGGATTICQGDVLNLYGTSGTGYSYQWLNNGIPISGSTSMYHTITQSGTYQVIVTSPNLCTDTSVIEIVTVNPTPNSSFTISGQTTFCQGDSTLLDAVGSTGYTYQWKSYGTNLIGATDSTYYIYQSGNYTLVTTNSFGCYTESAAQQITVNAVPGASILPLSSTSFCNGDSVILQANVGGGLTYQWYKNSSMLIGDTTTQIVANTTGAYTVEVGNAVNCTSISQAANVNVYPVPTSTFNLPSIGCGGDTITITYNGIGSSGAFYNWNFDGGIVISGTAQGPFEVIWNTAGFKNVSLSVNENGCISNLNTDTIEIKSIIANITAPNTTVCAGDSVFLYANTGQNLTYQWYQG